MVKDRAGGVSSPEHGLRQLEQGSGVLAAPRRLASPPRGQVDHAADCDRDGDEEQQREHVLRVFDRECVHGGREEPVEQHARDHGRRHGRPESADHRHRDHGHQVDQQVIGQAKPALGRDKGSRQQRQYGQERNPSQLPPAVQAAGLTQFAPPRPRRTAPARNLHNSQCAGQSELAHQQAGPSSGQASQAQHERRAGAEVPGQLELSVRRPGEASHGEPAGGHHEERRARLGTKARRGNHDRGERHDPAARHAAVAGRGDRADQQQRRAAGRQCVIGGYPARAPGRPRRRSGHRTDQCTARNGRSGRS